MPDDTPLALRVAILIWSRGEPLPLDVETSLMAQGFDVPALEARYRA